MCYLDSRLGSTECGASACEATAISCSTETTSAACVIANVLSRHVRVEQPAPSSAIAGSVGGIKRLVSQRRHRRIRRRSTLARCGQVALEQRDLARSIALTRLADISSAQEARTAPALERRRFFVHTHTHTQDGRTEGIDTALTPPASSRTSAVRRESAEACLSRRHCTCADRRLCATGRCARSCSSSTRVGTTARSLAQSPWPPS